MLLPLALELVQKLLRHWPRIVIGLAPLVFALLHASGKLEIPLLQRLDHFIYDARLRATMPATPDDRIVIVDIDEKSLDAVGQWPWGRNRLAALTTELVGRQKAAVLAFDVIFAEADSSSGLATLNKLASGPLRNQPGFASQLRQITPALDYDQLFANAMQGQPVVLGYYFTSGRGGLTKGMLPPPVFSAAALQQHAPSFYSWDGYASNIAPLTRSAAASGFFNSVTDDDGVLRSVPLVAEHNGHYYETLALAVYRLLAGMPKISPAYAGTVAGPAARAPLEKINLSLDSRIRSIAVDAHGAALVPYRGPGGAAGGSFRYLSAIDVLNGLLPPASLQDKIVLIGTTAPGLMDLRVTPVAQAYPGVEVHANLIAGLLDGSLLARPDFAAGFDLLTMLLAGLALTMLLPLLPATWAAVSSGTLLASVVALNFWLFYRHGWVLPLAAQVALVLAVFTLNMSYGFLVEGRSKRALANLFGSYIPPELVNEMVKDPAAYTMQAANKVLTVMFCDMRGFTRMSESMDPQALQSLLNSVFSRLTQIILSHQGTVDKYMGDCVMAFWGAPIAAANHAERAVAAALAMAIEVQQINAYHCSQGLPEIGIGIGINTGVMCVGDMGSDLRRSYTVIGDAVNLAARLEGLCQSYGVNLVASDQVKTAAPEFIWHPLGRVQVKGKTNVVSIWTISG